MSRPLIPCVITALRANDEGYGAAREWMVEDGQYIELPEFIEHEGKKYRILLEEVNA